MRHDDVNLLFAFDDDDLHRHCAGTIASRNHSHDNHGSVIFDIRVYRQDLWQTA